MCIYKFCDEFVRLQHLGYVHGPRGLYAIVGQVHLLYHRVLLKNASVNVTVISLLSNMKYVLTFMLKLLHTTCTTAH